MPTSVMPDLHRRQESLRVLGQRRAPARAPGTPLRSSTSKPARRAETKASSLMANTPVQHDQHQDDDDFEADAHSPVLAPFRSSAAHASITRLPARHPLQTIGRAMLRPIALLPPLFRPGPRRHCERL